MLQKGVGWYEIPVTDMARAKAFYGQLFGIEMGEDIKVNEVTLSMLGWKPGDQFGGALVQGEWYIPSLTGTVVYFVVQDIDAVLVRAEELGGRKMVLKMPIGEHGFIGFLKDTEGNKIGLHSM